MHEASQSLIHQVSDSDPSKLKDTAHTEGWRLNPLFIRSQIQIDDCRFECNHLQTSQSLIHQVSVSDDPTDEHGVGDTGLSQSLIHQVSVSDSTLFFERKYR